METSLQNTIKDIHSTPTKTVIYVTGGAVQALSWLLSVPGASHTVLEATVPYAQASLADILGKVPEQYCSEDTSIEIAKAAYRRAAALSPPGTPVVGLGATCALATEPMKRGEHRAHVACHSSRGTAVTSLHLVKGARSRAGEDEVVSRAVVQLLAEASGCDTSAFHVLQGPPQPSASEATALAVAAASPQARSPSSSPTPEVHGGSSQAAVAASSSSQPAASPAAGAAPQQPQSSQQQQRDVITSRFVAAADPLEALLSGAVRCVEYAGGQVTVDAPRRNLVVLPGSFNPLHEGHKQLLAAAAQAAGPGSQVAFELSIGNADKGRLPLDEVRRRVAQFTAAGLPVVLTSCPLFTQKAELLRGCRFVVGFDTAVRLVMPKYYKDSETQMVLEFERLRQAGCSFITAGRRDGTSGRFMTLADVGVPPVLKTLFPLGLTESDFRADISSTEIRARQAATTQAVAASQAAAPPS